MDENNNTDKGVKNFSMDEKGNIRNADNGTAVASRNARLFIVLGWVSAGLVLISFSFSMSLIFATAGVIFGMLVGRQQRGMGTAIIVTNIALVAFQLVLGLFLAGVIRRMVTRY